MPGWGVTYTDLVRVTVIAGGPMPLWFGREAAPWSRRPAQR
jgi:hypothetical protein